MHVKLVIRSRGNSHVARLYSRTGTQERLWESETCKDVGTAKIKAWRAASERGYIIINKE